MSEVGELGKQLDRIRGLLRDVRPILATRRTEMGPLLAALGQNVYEDLGPTLSEQALVEYETTHAVSLPPDYCAFLTQLGNGGPGPGYGLNALRAPFPHTAMMPGARCRPSRSAG